MNYIVAVKSGLYCFYSRGGGLWYCEYKGGAWQSPELLLDGISEYSVKLDGDDVIIISEDAKEGDVSRGDFIDGKFRFKLLVRDARVDGFNRLWGYLPKDGLGLGYGLGFVYNAPVKLVPVGSGHSLAIYQNGDGQNKFGYRELYNGEIGGYNLIHAGAGRVLDYSIVATNYDLHGFYLFRGMFGVSLIYKNKGAGGFSPGVTISSWPNIRNVLAFIIDGVLRLNFMIGNSLYEVDLDGDASEKLKLLQSFEGDVLKAEFLSGEGLCRGLICNEIYVDKDKPWDIKLWGDYITKDYIASASDGQNLQKNPEAPQSPDEADYNNLFDDGDGEFRKVMDNNV